METQIMVPAARPVVSMQAGAVVAYSVHVADYFGKEHRSVLASIDRLLKDEPSLGLHSFVQTPFVDPQNGQTYRAFSMDRRGFTVLAMGFTGKTALAFKLGYIDAFDAMEAELNRAAGAARPELDPNDPSQLRALLIGYSERTIALQGRVSELEPKGRALDRIATATGSLCITDAAKALQMQPKDLFAFMRQGRWLYRRAGSKRDHAFEDKRQAGLLEVKVTEPDAQGRTFEQVRVTPRGLARLSEVFSQPLLIDQQQKRSA